MVEQGKQHRAVPDAPGWHADPCRRHELRYWDGSQWTGHVSDHDDVGLEWAEVPASTGTKHETEAAIPAGVQLAGVGAAGNGTSGGGPSYGTRPEARPNWATTRTGLHALPGRPPPSPHFAGPMEANFQNAPAPGARWHQSPWLWVLTIVGSLVLIGAIVWPIAFPNDAESSRPSARVTALKPAATPDGYRVVGTDRYRLATPATWTVQHLDAGILEPEAGAGGAGQLTVVTDPFTADTVSAVPYRGVTGNLRDAAQLRSFETDFRRGVAGEINGLRVAGIRVQGRPAARLVATVDSSTGPMRTITTAVQTGAGVYQVTVTSASPERGALLNGLILPTFAAR